MPDTRELAKVDQTKSVDQSSQLTKAEREMLPSGDKVREIFKREDEDPGIVYGAVTLLSFFANHYTPHIQEPVPPQSDCDPFVPQIEVGPDHFQNLEWMIKNDLDMSGEGIREQLEWLMGRMNWDRLAPFVPFPNYTAAVYFKDLEERVFEDEICMRLARAHPQLFASITDSDFTVGVKKAIWRAVFPHINYDVVGSPKDADYCYTMKEIEKRMSERPALPPFKHEKGLTRHIAKHRNSFTALAGSIEPFLTQSEARLLTEFKRRGNEILAQSPDLAREIPGAEARKDYIAVAWAAYTRGMEIPVPNSKHQPEQNPYLYLLDGRNMPKPVFVVADYPHGRDRLRKMPSGPDTRFARLRTCFPLEGLPRNFYRNKVKRDSIWSYTAFASELWQYGAVQYAKDPEHSLPLQILQAKYLNPREIYSNSGG